MWAPLLMSAALVGGHPPASCVPTADGGVLMANATDKMAYEEYGFASARWSGSTLYVSGVIAHPREGEGKDVAAFQAQVRRAFKEIQRILNASGTDFSRVTLMNSFHVWDSPSFDGDAQAQFRAFSSVKSEFMPAPHPAWTAVGTTGLLIPSGVVEIQVIASIPHGGCDAERSAPSG